MSLHPGVHSVLICLLFLSITGCSPDTRAKQDHGASSMKQVQSPEDSSILFPAESFSSDYFPCSDCHGEIQSNTQRRELVEMHDDIVYNHDSENRWCLACHNDSNRDSLVLAGGKLLGFNESYKLCGQCHGPKIRDWRLGIHGKRTGEWKGQKQYLLCVHCHDPHSPKIKKLQPMPPPRRPEHILIDTSYERAEKKSTSP